jgi:glycerol-3-phosphate dehydrogenase
VLSVFGGKITTYRKLAEHALTKLEHWFPDMRPAWTAGTPLPGGELPQGWEKFTEVELRARYPWLPDAVRRALARRHGAAVPKVVADAHAVGDLGTYFGAELFAREIDYLIEHEWARTAEDVVYRRTKTGLHLTADQRAAVTQYVAARVPTNALPMR